MRYTLLFLLMSLVVSIAVIAHAQSTSFTVTNSGMTAYIINGASNPTLTLTRGRTYAFIVTSPGHPFDIKTQAGAGTGNQYTSGVTGEGVSNGVLTFQVPLNAPNTLFYQCEIHAVMSGQLLIVDPPAVPANGVFAALVLGVFLFAAGIVAVRRRALV